MKTIAIALGMILIAAPLFAAQKYEVNFKLKYNAVTAEELVQILHHLEKLKGKHRKDPVQIEPCVWEIKVEGNAGTDGMTITAEGTTIDWSDVNTTLIVVDYPKYMVDDNGHAWVQSGEAQGWVKLVPGVDFGGAQGHDIVLETENGTEYKYNRETERWVRR